MINAPRIPDFWKMPVSQVKDHFKTDLDAGLTSDEVQKRQNKYGCNVSEPRKKSEIFRNFARPFEIFFSIILTLIGDPVDALRFFTFRCFMMVVLVVAVIVFSDPETCWLAEAISLVVITLAMACIDAARDTKTESVLKILKKTIPQTCTVRRNGQRSITDAKELVPGDVVILEPGDLVPADLRLVETNHLKIEDAVFTGRLCLEEKDTVPHTNHISPYEGKNMAFFPTWVVDGNGIGIVTATGSKTELGKITAIPPKTSEIQSPGPEKMVQVERNFGLFAFGACILMVVTGVFQERETAGICMLAISLALATVPNSFTELFAFALVMGRQGRSPNTAATRNWASGETDHLICTHTLKAIRFVLSVSTGLIVVVFAAILAGWPLPLWPVQILWVSFVAGGLVLLTLMMDLAASTRVKRHSAVTEAAIFQDVSLFRILRYGVMNAVFPVLAFQIGIHSHLSAARTMAFAVLGFSLFSHVLNIRFSNRRAFENLFSDKWFFTALFVCMVCMGIVFQVPHLRSIFHIVLLTPLQWLWVAGLSASPVPLMAGIKFLRRS